MIQKARQRLKFRGAVGRTAMFHVSLDRARNLATVHKRTLNGAVAAIVLAAFLAVSAIGAGSGHAATGCPPSIRVAEARQVHPTRVELVVNGDSCSEILSHFEYSTSEDGPWSQTETREIAGSKYSVRTELRLLSPKTNYFARAFVENESGIALERFEFTTTTISFPEITDFRIRQAETETATGTTYGDFEAEIDGNGAETQYQLEYATSPGGPWTPASGSGTSGTITVAEDFIEAKAHISGLSPNTEYFLRLKANNEIGDAEETKSFSTNPLYPQVVIGSTTNVTAGSARLHGSILTRSSETHWRFEYASSQSALEEGHGLSGPEGTISTGEASEAYSQVEGELTGLETASTYYVRLFADNGHEPTAISNATRLDTAGPPVVSTFAVHSFAAGSETIRVLGSVEPRGYDTHYHFQYVTQEDFDSTGWTNATDTPEADAGTGELTGGAFPVFVVAEDLPDLAVGAIYHFRLLATNEQGSATATDQTVTVPTPAPAEETSCPNGQLRAGASAHLPDCRAYEQVTPAEKGGSADNWVYSGQLQSPVLIGESGEHAWVEPQFSKWGPTADASNNSYFVSRESDGWELTSATPQPQAGDKSYRPSLFDSELTQTGLNVGWSTGTFNASPELEFLAGAPGGPYAAIASTSRAKPTGWVAASGDFGELILDSEDHTLCGHATGTISGHDLYEYSEGQCRQVNAGVGTCGATIARGIEGYGGSDRLDGGHSVSSDGSRVFFEAPSSGCAQSHLYMRVGGTETIDIGSYKFLAADAQGSTLLLEKGEGETREFYLYDVQAATAKLLVAADGPQHLIASGDLTAFYFRSRQQLTAESPPPNTKSEDAGATPEDLYRYDIAAKQLQFVVQTSEDGGYGGGTSVSPDGRYYYWASEGVSGVFSETDPGASDSNPQVYRYDSVENVVQCMSCASPFDPRPQRFATFVPKDIEATPNAVPNRTIASADGNYVFFDTTAALVSQDADGELHAGTQYLSGTADFYYSTSSDVYEWRKNGVEGCSHVQGCIALISSGTGGLKNILLGTTPTGHDVFFATHSQLVPQDDDSQGDVYDARIGGGFLPPAPPPSECEGDACQSPLAAPIDTTPGSFAFSGPGNLPPPLIAKPKRTKPPAHCKRGTVRRKGKCAKKKAAKGKVVKKPARRAVSHKRGGHR